MRLHKLSRFHELGGKSSPHGHQSSGNTSKKAQNICWRYQRVTWWDTMQMVLDKTSECDDQGARESVIMGLRHHAKLWPTLLFLCGCFVKQTARGGVIDRLLLSCHFLSTKSDASKFQYLIGSMECCVCGQFQDAGVVPAIPSSDSILKVKRTGGSCCFTVRLCNQ